MTRRIRYDKFPNAIEVSGTMLPKKQRKHRGGRVIWMKYNAFFAQMVFVSVSVGTATEWAKSEILK